MQKSICFSHKVTSYHQCVRLNGTSARVISNKIFSRPNGFNTFGENHVAATAGLITIVFFLAIVNSNRKVSDLQTAFAQSVVADMIDTVRGEIVALIGGGPLELFPIPVPTG